jgi:predicted nucleic acid-binding protein
MVLVDTSICIDRFRTRDEILKALLLENQVIVHPLIAGELACANLKNRAATLRLLQSLPACQVATDIEAYAFIEMKKAFGMGIGFLDVHLLCASAPSNCPVWTKDKALSSVADSLGLAFKG